MRGCFIQWRLCIIKPRQIHMRKLIASLMLAVVLTAFTVDEDIFVGKILYKYSFSDMNGNEITEKLSPYFGREQHYFIDSENYKALDENGDLVQLYSSETNTYYYFNKGKFVQKIDGSTQTSKKAVVTELDLEDEIAGYNCKAVQIETDNATTVYYYSPSIKTDKEVFSKHNFGEWNRYLEATGGGLTLKFVMTDHKNGYVWTSVATEVSRMDLSAEDFVLPSDANKN
ncbi:hypothetical protein D770_04995 [Flammeovirgaceae bacterium 311]|nr:hypothetical protein D770_04995 [Flammeovirgaceae bacterium 311]